MAAIASRVLEGVMIKPYGDTTRNARVFVQNADQPNVVLVIHGLASGIMSLCWDQTVAEAVKKLGFAFAQANLSSSFVGSLLSTLTKDAEELQLLVNHLRKTYKHIVLLGHSTGCMSAIRYCQMYSQTSSKVDGIIFLGAVSDRQALGSLDVSFDEVKAEADKHAENGEPNRILSKRFCFELASTAFRCKSLLDRLGDDDMFSTDLTEEELTPIFKDVTCPCLFIYGESDEYIPNFTAMKEFTARMKNVASKTAAYVDIKFIPGDHELNKVEDHGNFTSLIEEFLQTQCN